MCTFVETYTLISMGGVQKSQKIHAIHYSDKVQSRYKEQYP